MNRAMRRQASRAKPGKAHMRINPAAALNPIIMCKPLESHETVGMKLALREAYESIRTGTGTKSDWDHIVISYNAWQVLGESIDPELHHMMLPAGEALIRAKQRVLDGKAMLWDGPAIEALQVFMDVYDTVIDAVSPQQIEDAIMEAHLRATGKKLNWRMK